jgi:6-phosphogluconolactonase
MPNKPTVQIVSDAAMLARVAADWFVRAVQDAISVRGRATVALSGGGTPQGLYSRLAGPPHSTRLDFAAIDFFQGDERCVPPNDPLSSFGMIDRLLFSPARIPGQSVYRIHGELDSTTAADDYERRLRRRFPGDWPAFDLVVLGIGADGHTASLFPGSPALDERRRWAVPAEGPPPVPHRVTLTLPAINHAAFVLFLADTADKADPVARALAGDLSLPAARIAPHAGQCRWLLTPDAAAKIST